MRAYYKDKDKNRICIVCETVNKPLVVCCGKCGISFRSAHKQEDLLRSSNEMFAGDAVERVLLGEDT